MSLFDQRQSEDELRSEIARLRGQLALFQKDGARLDFLERNCTQLISLGDGRWAVRSDFSGGFTDRSLREALDGAAKLLRN